MLCIAEGVVPPQEQLEAGEMELGWWPGSLGREVVEAVAGTGSEMQVEVAGPDPLRNRLRESNPVLEAARAAGIVGDWRGVPVRWEDSQGADQRGDGPQENRTQRFLAPGGDHM